MKKLLRFIDLMLFGYSAENTELELLSDKLDKIIKK
jgi:hypothetical protein